MKKKKARAKAAKKPKARKIVKSKVKAKKSSAKRPPVKKAKKSKKAKKAKAAASSTPKGVVAPVNGVLLGLVDDFFAKIGVIALTLKASVAVGQKIQVLGHTTNFEETVGSMQIDHASVTQAGSGDSVGIKVGTRARGGDHVYLLK